MNRTNVLRILLVACLGLALVLVIVSLVSLVDRPAAESVTATRTAFAAQVGPASGPPLCFVSDAGTTCVQRVGIQSTNSISDQVRTLIDSMLAGPTAAEQANGVDSALPDGAQLDRLSVADDRVSVDLVLPDAYLKSLTPAQVENVNEQFLTTLTPYNFQRIDVNVRDAQGNYRPLSTFLAPITIPHKSGQASPSAQAQASASGGQPPVAGQPQPRGGLYGKTVFVSAGHGWYWSTSQNQYRTQRPVYPTAPYPSGDGIIEDFNNAEAVDQYLLPYLWNSGADAWTVRERDMNSSMLIVDDKSSGFSTQGGWLTGSGGGYGGSYRFVWPAAAGTTATATWTFTPPTTDTYAVYLWSPEIAATRAVDAHFYVEHAGGVTPVIVSQARDNSNWRYIGSYPFYGGKPGRVWVTNQSSTPGVFVLADAIRIGGGIADTPPPTTLSPSGRPRWEDQA